MILLQSLQIPCFKPEMMQTEVSKVVHQITHCLPSEENNFELVIRWEDKRVDCVVPKDEEKNSYLGWKNESISE